jgi:hypothetical protein
MGTSMLELMNRLQVLPDNRKLFGLTSHYSLYLLSEDMWESPWYVRINVIDKHRYQICYLLPEKITPWPEAYVISEARSLDEAVEMILIGMEKSAGW